MAIFFINIKKLRKMKMTEKIEIVCGAVLVVAFMFAMTFLGAIMQG